MFYLLFILTIAFPRVCQSDWVDPDGFGPSAKFRGTQDPPSQQCDCGEALATCRKELESFQGSTDGGDCVNELYLKRFVNLFLKNLNDEDIPHDIRKELSLEIALSGRDIGILRKFGRGEVHFSEVDHIISNLFHPSWKSVQYWEKVASGFKTFASFIRGLSSMQVAAALCIFCFIYFLWLIRMMSYGRAVAVLLALMFFVSYGLKWEYRRQEKEMEAVMNHVENAEIPDDCFPNKQGFLPWIVGKGAVNCEKYLKAHHIDPILSVSPSKVLSEVLSDFFLHPFFIILDLFLGAGKQISNDYPVVIRGLIHTVLSIVGLCLFAYILIKISCGFLLTLPAWFSSSGESAPQIDASRDKHPHLTKSLTSRGSEPDQRETPPFLSAPVFSFRNKLDEPPTSEVGTTVNPPMFRGSTFSFGNKAGPTFLSAVSSASTPSLFDSSKTRTHGGVSKPFKRRRFKKEVVAHIDSTPVKKD